MTAGLRLGAFLLALAAVAGAGYGVGAAVSDLTGDRTGQAEQMEQMEQMEPGEMVGGESQ